jgi:hypothetical protein
MANSNPPKITKGERAALWMIARREGTFHSVLGHRLQQSALAYPVSGVFNFLVGCNCRTADGWMLTDLGAAHIGSVLVPAA